MNRFLYIGLGLIITILAFSCKPSHKSSPTVVKPKAPTHAATVTDTLPPIKITEPDLKALVDTLNEYLVSYDSLRSMAEYDKAALQKLKLTKNDIDTLLQGTDNQTGVTGSSVAVTYQVVIDSLLTKILTHPQIVKYDLDRILKMYVTKSDDGKLFNLVIPENTGGSYKSDVSYLHYRADNGKVYNFYPDRGLSDTAGAANFNPDGFGKIYTITTKHGVKYLLTGEVQGCNTCWGEYMQLVHFDNGKAIIDFSLSAGKRFSSEPDEDEQGITYDEKRKVIELRHNASDDQDCDCRTDSQREQNEEQPELRNGKNWICIFKFNGNTFVLDKKKSRSPV